MLVGLYSIVVNFWNFVAFFCHIEFQSVTQFCHFGIFFKNSFEKIIQNFPNRIEMDPKYPRGNGKHSRGSDDVWPHVTLWRHRYYSDPCLTLYLRLQNWWSRDESCDESCDNNPCHVTASLTEIWQPIKWFQSIHDSYQSHDMSFW